MYWINSRFFTNFQLLWNVFFRYQNMQCILSTTFLLFWYLCCLCLYIYLPSSVTIKLQNTGKSLSCNQLTGNFLYPEFPISCNTDAYCSNQYPYGIFWHVSVYCQCLLKLGTATVVLKMLLLHSIFTVITIKLLLLSAITVIHTHHEGWFYLWIFSASCNYSISNYQ